MEKIQAINVAIQSYFDDNGSVNKIPAKDLMEIFIAAGVFNKDHRNGLPIRNILRKLDAQNNLHLIPSVYPDRKLKNTNWFFIRKHFI